MYYYPPPLLLPLDFRHSTIVFALRLSKSLALLDDLERLVERREKAMETRWQHVGRGLVSFTRRVRLENREFNSVGIGE